MTPSKTDTPKTNPNTGTLLERYIRGPHWAALRLRILTERKP